MITAIEETTDIGLTLQRVQLNKPYEQIVADFERLIPAVDVARLENLVDSNGDSGQLTAAIKEMTGDKHLMRFYRVRSGDLFTVLSGSRVESVKYIVGNVFIAQQVFARDLTAGLHVPFAVNIYGRNGITIMEYFRPSSFLAYVSSDNGTKEIGRRLDELMNKLVRNLDGSQPT